VPNQHKDARVEWERRFLLDRLPPDANVTQVRRITDRETVFKLTQKLPAEATGARQGLITTLYLTEAEFQLLANLPGKMLRKTRHSVPSFGIDVFEDGLAGLVMAEAEFNSGEEAPALSLPPFIVCEVTEDPRFTGGELVRASREELEKLLAEFQIRM
jgi:CYTH domain-containing protein